MAEKKISGNIQSITYEGRVYVETSDVIVLLQEMADALREQSSPPSAVKVLEALRTDITNIQRRNR